jgi:L-ascorbate metabolism protein UlaG (beta-lactamase superfamily)
MKHLFFIVAATLLLAACNPLNKISFAEHQPFDENEISDKLRLEFNGTANFYIQYKDKTVLTDPFMTNPSMGKVMFGKLYSDSLLISQYNPKTSGIQMVVIGHAHYDHILDLPYYLPYLHKETKIIGSENSAMMAKTLQPTAEVINALPYKESVYQYGKWIYATDSSIRILPIQSAHLPHIMGLHLYHGHFKKPISEFPVKGKHFIQDETLAYLIDFLDNEGKPEKRVYFSSSAVQFPNGFFSLDILNEKSVDVAILSSALFQKAKGYPNDLVNYIRPEQTIICHWENFFRTRDKKLKPVSLTKFSKLFKAINELDSTTQFHFVQPGNSVMFE